VTPTRVTVIAVLGVAAVWAPQIAWLNRHDADVLVRDLHKAEYVTALHLKDATPAIVGHLSKVDRKKGAKLVATDVEDVPRDQSVVAVVVPLDRPWGRALVVGLCVDVWNGGQAVTGEAPLKIVSVLPLAGEDKTLAYLLAPTAGGVPGKVLAAKELMLSLVPCRSPTPDDVLL
jgi:hypothetical protein